MSVDDLQRYESEVELDLYRQYREVVGMFRHVVETERRFYLANDVDVQVRTTDGERSSSRCSCATSGSGTCTGREGSRGPCGF